MSSRRELANAIRALSMDAVQKAKSGHPGAPMGMADIAEVLWNDHLKHNPANANWADRDRFVLSNGHGSMLIYSLLHLTGYDLSIDEIKNFRQLHAKTPGHPEYGYADGVETTTGPLGQGISNAVGMAIAERTLAAHFNKTGHSIVDHYTYVFMGDGCLMEGLSHEACSMAGTLGLGKLIAFWDDNDISIDGHIGDWMEKGVPTRFKSYNWHVISDVDGHDPEAINAAIIEAKSIDDRPTLICTKTIIGYGSPNLAGSHNCHGAPLGEEEIAKTRENIGWNHEPFEIPQEIYDGWSHKAQGKDVEDEWNEKFRAYSASFPDEAAEFERRMAGTLPENFSVKMDEYIAKTQEEMPNIASRKASQNAIEAMGPIVPELFGGSADLTGSNNTKGDGNNGTQHMSYGVREFAMTAMTNGMLLHGGYRPYSGTFLVFMEYARNAVRLAALMKIPNIFVYTHDSVMVGEDGPTHQPIEQLTSLRTTPGLSTWRPCDSVETMVAWRYALESTSMPTALIFSRQKLSPQTRDDQTLMNIQCGGYVLRDPDCGITSIIIATGSEIELAVNASLALESEGIGARVISMPSVDRFLDQAKEYQDAVLLPEIRARVAVEAAHPDYWYRFVGLDGEVVGIRRYGVSAPGDQVLAHLGVTVDNVVQSVKRVLH